MKIRGVKSCKIQLMDQGVNLKFLEHKNLSINQSSFKYIAKLTLTWNGVTNFYFKIIPIEKFLISLGPLKYLENYWIESKKNLTKFKQILFNLKSIRKIFKNNSITSCNQISICLYHENSNI